MANYCWGEKTLLPRGFGRRCAGERPRCPRGSDAFALVYLPLSVAYGLISLTTALLVSS